MQVENKGKTEKGQFKTLFLKQSYRKSEISRINRHEHVEVV